MGKHKIEDLWQMQSLPLSAKVRMTENRINAWVDEYGVDGVYVSFSGGKDSQVVLELVKMARVKYRAVYNVTTNDPADNVRFIKSKYPDVEFSVPKESLLQMIQRKGVPTMFNRWCCAILKEKSASL